MTDIAAAGTFKLGDRTVNRMGYGAMQLAGPGVFGPPKDRAAAIAVLREAVASGVTEPRAPVSGFSHGWLTSLPPRVSTSEAALRASARSRSLRLVSSLTRTIGAVIEPVMSAASAFSVSNTEPSRKLQPPSAAPAATTAIAVTTRLAMRRIGDRPARHCALYTLYKRLGAPPGGAEKGNAVLQT